MTLKPNQEAYFAVTTYLLAAKTQHALAEACFSFNAQKFCCWQRNFLPFV